MLLALRLLRLHHALALRLLPLLERTFKQPVPRGPWLRILTFQKPEQCPLWLRILFLVAIILVLRLLLLVALRRLLLVAITLVLRLLLLGSLLRIRVLASLLVALRRHLFVAIILVHRLLSWGVSLGSLSFAAP